MGAESARTQDTARLPQAMLTVALRMLRGDRAKYLSLIFAITFSTFLIAQQSSLFACLLGRAQSQIRDVGGVDLWVMDPATEYFDEVYALSDNDLLKVRSVPGVLWAVPMFKGNANARTEDGSFRSTLVLGLDDASLTGAPLEMLAGRIENLREPDAVIIDKAGYELLYPNEPLRLGRILEMNDHRVRLVGVCRPSPPFNSTALLFARYSQALTYVGRERRQMSFVLAKSQPGVDLTALSKSIREATGLKALTTHDFGWQTIWYYVNNTGIPINFGLTVAVALIVGTIVAGQTFYIFTIENLRQFGALKAIGTTDKTIILMVLLQALLVGAIGYSIGIGLAALFFIALQNSEATRGMVLLWQVMAGTAGVVVLIVTVASLLSVRKILVLEPAEVFRG